jgi:hypothetical protein
MTVTEVKKKQAVTGSIKRVTLLKRCWVDRLRRKGRIK